MRLSLGNILEQVGGYVDQEATIPTGSDLTLRINYVNRALSDWANTYDWNELTKKHSFNVTISSITLPLPVNFKKPMSKLYHYESATPTEYEICDIEDIYIHDDSDYVAYVSGNLVDGYSVIVPRGFPSGASVCMDIQTFPSSLVTTTDIVPMSTPEFIVNQTIGYVLESRSDSRFPLVKADAQRWLFNMLEAQHVKNKGATNAIRTPGKFRIGMGR